MVSIFHFQFFKQQGFHDLPITRSWIFFSAICIFSNKHSIFIELPSNIFVPFHSRCFYQALIDYLEEQFTFDLIEYITINIYFGKLQKHADSPIVYILDTFSDVFPETCLYTIPYRFLYWYNHPLDNSKFLLTMNPSVSLLTIKRYVQSLS